MATATNAEMVCHLNVPGGGQIWVTGSRCCVGPMEPPHGTSIYDNADPGHPVKLAAVQMPHWWRCRKVRAVGDVMVVDHEQTGDGGPSGFAGGLPVYDVAERLNPVLAGK